jgi:N-acetylneuraminic acid mutarotase
MSTYDGQIAVFGGSGKFYKDIKIRETFNDLWIWDTFTDQKWDKIESFGISPLKRMGHAGDTLGGVMLVHGGFNTEAKVVLDDFNLYDF